MIGNISGHVLIYLRAVTPPKTPPLQLEALSVPLIWHEDPLLRIIIRKVSKKKKNIYSEVLPIALEKYPRNMALLLRFKVEFFNLISSFWLLLLIQCGKDGWWLAPGPLLRTCLCWPRSADDVTAESLSNLVLRERGGAEGTGSEKATGC